MTCDVHNMTSANQQLVIKCFSMIWALWKTALPCPVHTQACRIATLERSNQIYSDHSWLPGTGWLCFPRLDSVQQKAVMMMAWVPETAPGHMHWFQDSLSHYKQRLGAFTMITIILLFHLTLCILCHSVYDLLMWWLPVYLEFAEPTDWLNGIWDIHHLIAATYTCNLVADVGCERFTSITISHLHDHESVM